MVWLQRNAELDVDSTFTRYLKSCIQEFFLKEVRAGGVVPKDLNEYFGYGFYVGGEVGDPVRNDAGQLVIPQIRSAALRKLRGCCANGKPGCMIGLLGFQMW